MEGRKTAAHLAYIVTNYTRLGQWEGLWEKGSWEYVSLHYESSFVITLTFTLTSERVLFLLDIKKVRR
jgi:hypothetical protein